MMINRGRFINIIKLAIGLFLISWLLSQIDIKQVFLCFRKGNIFYLLNGLLFFSLAWTIVLPTRLHILVRGFTHTYLNSLKLLLISLFFNQFLPSSVGGDGYKVIYLKKIKDSTWGEPFMLTLLERTVGLLVLLFAGVAYSIMYHERITKHVINSELKINFLARYVLFAVIVIFIGMLFLFKRKIKTLLTNHQDFFKACKRTLFKLSKLSYISLIFLSFFFHLLRLFGFFYFVRYFNESILLEDLIFVLFATAFIALLPVSLGGLGIREGTIAIGLSLFGVSKSSAITIAFMNRILLLLFALLGGILYIINNHPKKR